VFRSALSFDEDVFDAVRDAGRAAPGAMGRYTKQFVVPYVEQRVDTEIAPYPGPVSRPFEFSTPKSRRWYFANKKVPYSRTGEVGRSWEVKTDLRQSEGQITIRNFHRASKWVFGIGLFRQVPGHRNTGWGRGFASRFESIRRGGQDKIIDGWYLVVTGQYR
jgi:hypothetical protein